MAPPESQSSCCCCSRPDSYVSLVSLLSCNVGQTDGLARTTRRCSVTPPSVSSTTLPKCVVQCANSLQMLSISSSDIQLRRHRRVHRSSRCSLRLVGTPTRLVDVSDVCGQHVMLPRLSGCIPCRPLRCWVGLMPDMPVTLTRCGRLSLPVKLQFLVVTWCVRLGAA